MLTAERLEEVLKSYKVQSAYSHFSKKIVPPFLVWTSEDTENFNADNSVYMSIHNFQIELYSRTNVLNEEKKLENYLTENGILWEKNSQSWIDEEKLYMSVYEVS